MSQPQEKISEKEVRHVADLARLDMDDESIGIFSGQISNILQYVDMLNQVDTENIPPTSHAISLTNAFREDEVHLHLNRDLGLLNAPEKEDGYFIVPKVIG